MDINGIVNTALFLTGIGAVVLFCTFLRPAIARTTLGRRAKHVEYKVADSLLAGEIDLSDPAFQELMGFIHMLSEHPREFGLTEFQAMEMTLRKAGFRDPSEVPLPALSYAHMRPHGRAVMIDADKELHLALTEYLVAGSKMWWLLTPARAMWRAFRSTPTAHPTRVTPPSVVAESYRRAAHDGGMRTLIDDEVPQFA